MNIFFFCWDLKKIKLVKKAIEKKQELSKSVFYSII
jgi:hypothetical protein